jgi:hypothetical protein
MPSDGGHAVLSYQQRQVLVEQARREGIGSGAQTVADYEGFPIVYLGSPKPYGMTNAQACACLKRLANRGLLEVIRDKPLAYLLSAEGRRIVGVAKP